MSLRLKSALAVCTVAASSILAMSGCKACENCGNDPIVNPGVDGKGADAKTGYVPWWVRAGFPNGAGIIVVE